MTDADVFWADIFSGAMAPRAASAVARAAATNTSVGLINDPYLLAREFEKIPNVRSELMRYALTEPRAALQAYKDFARDAYEVKKFFTENDDIATFPILPGVL